MDNPGYLYGAPMSGKTAAKLAADMDEGVARVLRRKGYLVLPPGDTSPLAKLLHAAARQMHARERMTVAEKSGGIDEFHNVDVASEEMLAGQLDMVEAAKQAVEDPAIRAWLDRK